MGAAGDVGTGLAAIGSVGAGLVPGAELLATAGLLLSKFDPADEELALNPFPPDLYAPFAPCWGLPVHPEDLELEILGLQIGAGGNVAEAAAGAGLLRERLAWEVVHRGGRRRYLTGALTGAGEGAILQAGRDTDRPPIPGLGFADGFEPRRFAIEHVPYAKPLLERDVLKVSTIHRLIGRILGQWDSAPPEPTFAYLDVDLELADFALAWYGDHAFAQSGRIHVRRASEAGPLDDYSGDVESYSNWRSKALKSSSGIYARWSRIREDAAQAHELERERWIQWRNLQAQEDFRAKAIANLTAQYAELLSDVLAGLAPPSAIGSTAAELAALGFDLAPVPELPTMLPDLAGAAPKALAGSSALETGTSTTSTATLLAGAALAALLL